MNYEPRAQRPAPSERVCSSIFFLFFFFNGLPLHHGIVQCSGGPATNCYITVFGRNTWWMNSSASGLNWAAACTQCEMLWRLMCALEEGEGSDLCDLKWCQLDPVDTWNPEKSTLAGVLSIFWVFSANVSLCHWFSFNNVRTCCFSVCFDIIFWNLIWFLIGLHHLFSE